MVRTRASRDVILGLVLGLAPAVLTATTPQLQRFARRYADDEKAFGDRFELTR